jgi:hypothetical protein
VKGGMIIKLDEYEKEVLAIAEEISFYLQKSGQHVRIARILPKMCL